MNPKVIYTLKAELLSTWGVTGSGQGALGETEMRQTWPHHRAEGLEKGMYTVPRYSEEKESTSS